MLVFILGFLSGSVVKNPLANSEDARDTGFVPGSGRSPGEGNGYSIQYACLKNSIDRGTWWATVHGVTKSQTRLNDTFTFKVLIWRDFQDILNFKRKIQHLLATEETWV